jgi:hypothetical protein
LPPTRGGYGANTVTSINVQAELGPDDGPLVQQDLGMGDHGASLVRPDGVVAWRSVLGPGFVDVLASVMKSAALSRECAA